MEQKKIKVGGRVARRIGINRSDVAEICAECAVSDVPTDCTFDCTQHAGEPKDRFWVERDQRTSVAKSGKHLLENITLWESTVEKKKTTRCRAESSDK